MSCSILLKTAKACIDFIYVYKLFTVFHNILYTTVFMNLHTTSYNTINMLDTRKSGFNLKIYKNEIRDKLKKKQIAIITKTGSIFKIVNLIK